MQNFFPLKERQQYFHTKMTQRQIKFRAWDKNQKRWVYFELYPNASTTPSIYRGNDFSDWQQFTGLLDKNGKEIYEGDIIQITSEKYRIEWNQLHCAWCLFDTDGGMQKEIIADWINDDGSTPKRWENKNLEVIGNIYENPELI